MHDHSNGEDSVTHDAVNHPAHYTSDPSGIECIEITRHMDFNIGNAFKYVWRAGIKNIEDQVAVEAELQDIRKAIWYLEDEKQRVEFGGSHYPIATHGALNLQKVLRFREGDIKGFVNSIYAASMCFEMQSYYDNVLAAIGWLVKRQYALEDIAGYK